MFLSGFGSDMNGTKALFLDEFCKKNEIPYLRFDYSGTGQSGGIFEDGTIGKWFQDTLDAFDHITKGLVILVGSSMGGWIGLKVAMARPERVKAFIGLAAAPDFTRDVYTHLNEAQKADLKEKHYLPLPARPGETPLRLARALLEEGMQQCILDGPILLNCPVRLIQGMKDKEVPWQKAQKIMDAVTTQDKALYLREKSDHRLSSPEDLAVLGSLVEELSGKKSNGVCI